MKRAQIEVCLSPALLGQHDLKGKDVVVIDIFRATSTMVVAMANGALRVRPVSSVQECVAMGAQLGNSITAGEREGRVAEGLEYGNSPRTYTETFISGKNLVLTTTNGTKLLHMVEGAGQVLVGSFLNLDAVCSYLGSRANDVVLACAAWKDRINLEDALFAGAVVKQLENQFHLACDSSKLAKVLYEDALLKSEDLFSYLKQSSHYNRLSAYGLEGDMEFCSQKNTHPIVVTFNGKDLELVAH